MTRAFAYREKFDPLVSACALSRRFAHVEGPEVLTATVLDGAGQQEGALEQGFRKSVVLGERCANRSRVVFAPSVIHLSRDTRP